MNVRNILMAVGFVLAAIAYLLSGILGFISYLPAEYPYVSFSGSLILITILFLGAGACFIASRFFKSTN